MNTLHLQDIVKGQYGRQIAYTDVEEITEDNILSVVANAIGIFNKNKRVFQYLWNYKNGDQPIRYRRKTIRDDINNPIVENHAWEIVRFKNFSEINMGSNYLFRFLIHRGFKEWFESVRTPSSSPGADIRYGV